MKKGSQVLIGITACFVFLVAGIFIGRNTIGAGITVEPDTAAKQATSSTEDAAFQSGKININTAGVDELVLLPNIGETIAQRIVTYRQLHGDFKSIDDLTNVEGIGSGRLAEISKYITVGGS